jgi:hypothetical protein
MRKNKKTWFWAWIVLGTVRKDSLGTLTARCEVWKNLVIIQASSPVEAFRKAEKIGKESAGDSRGTLRLDGKPAKQMFLGVQDMGIVHEELKDGAEITWNLCRLTFAKAKNLVCPKARLLRELGREFSHVS